MAADQVDAGALEPGDLAGVRAVGGEGGASIQDRLDVELAPDRLASSGHPTRRAQGVPAAQERLRGHAGPVGAFPADQLGLDDGRAQALPAGVVGHVLADGSAAEHNQVVVLGSVVARSVIARSVVVRALGSCRGAHAADFRSSRARRMAESRKKTPPRMA